MLTSVDDPVFWDNLYENGEANWDLKSPNPVFMELLYNSDLLSPCRLLITGCGKGYDAVAAAKAGYEVTAVDFSAKAVEHTRMLAENENAELRIIQSNVFGLNEVLSEKFDAVYEYTTFCAINPERRKEFAEEINSLLLPGGKFAAVIFPVDGRPGGPPFNIDLVEFYKIFSEYLNLELSSREIRSVKPRKYKEVLQVYIKPGRREII